MLSALHARMFPALIASLALTACSSLGFLSGNVDMPNSGVRAKSADGVVEFVQVFEPAAPEAESASSLLAPALDRLAGWAFGALRDAAVARLDKLAGEFTGGFEAERSEFDRQTAAGIQEWRAVRGVRFAVKTFPDGAAVTKET
jgi:hypothetical protein